MLSEVVTHSAAETIAFGREFAKNVECGAVIVLDGDLGAGKTQLTKGFAEVLGVKTEIISPTFNILLEYDGADTKLYHFDLYRLEDETELDDIGFYEILEAGGVCIIE